MTPRSRHIVIVDDEPNIGSSLRLILEGDGHRVTVCRSAAALRELRQVPADLFLVDVRLPDANGIDLLRELRTGDENASVIMISGHATVRDAVEATRSGALDFLEKPLARDRVVLAVRNALERFDLLRENLRYRELIGDGAAIGQSAPFRRLLEQAELVARSDASVLLTGDSGTGKELIAGYIHRRSPWAKGPFVKVNCAAIPTELIESELFGHEKGAFTGAASLHRGKFEQADGGTIFLDEIGDLHETAQAKLLRILQDGEVQRVGSEASFRVSVRVVAATNRDIDQLIRERRFRADLHYRIGVVPIRVPTLRERCEDVAELANHFLADFCSRNNVRPKQLETAVLAVLKQYEWPGNVRELRNIVERMAILTPGPIISAGAIPVEIRQPRGPADGSLDAARDHAERARINQALDQSGGNVAQAARLLGSERTRLHKRMRALGIRR